MDDFDEKCFSKMVKSLGVKIWILRPTFTRLGKIKERLCVIFSVLILVITHNWKYWFAFLVAKFPFLPVEFVLLLVCTISHQLAIKRPFLVSELLSEVSWWRPVENSNFLLIPKFSCCNGKIRKSGCSLQFSPILTENLLKKLPIIALNVM